MKYRHLALQVLLAAPIFLASPFSALALPAGKTPVKVARPAPSPTPAGFSTKLVDQQTGKGFKQTFWTVAKNTPAPPATSDQTNLDSADGSDGNFMVGQADMTDGGGFQTHHVLIRAKEITCMIGGPMVTARLFYIHGQNPPRFHFSEAGLLALESRLVSKFQPTLHSR